MWLVHNRFAKFPLTPWEKAQVFLHRLMRGPRKAAREIGNRLFGKARERAYFDKLYPILPAGSPPPGQWIEDKSVPNGRRWEGPTGWRTRHGPAMVCWYWGKPAYRAWNIQLPDSSRSDAQGIMARWRRPGRPPLVWIYGSLVLHESDIEFIDLDEQWKYTPPALCPTPNLEAELAHSKDFVMALQDDAFALTAYSQLCHLEWMKIGHPKFEQFTGNRRVAGMIAGLRERGEIYLDVQNERLSGREKPPHGSYSQDQVRLVQHELGKIGWRTHTRDEVQAVMREEMRRRLKDRVKLLRRVKELEHRREQHCQRWVDKPRWRPMAMVFYEGDDPSWIEPLTHEEREAMSAETSVRLHNLAVTARISEKEFEALNPFIIGSGTPPVGLLRPDASEAP